jgi:creatinine amidohydrolase
MNDAIEQERVVLLPVGTIEQHGPHLPMDVDNMLPRSVSIGAAERLPDDVLIMPNIPYGYNAHHMDFPGQITITGNAFIQYCLCVTKSLAYHGFTKIIIVDGHGSNVPLLDLVARQTILETHGKVACTSFIHTQLAKDVAGQIRESERGGMAHACEWETSMYLHLDEKSVRKERIVDEIGAQPSQFFWGELQNPSPYPMTEWYTMRSKTGVSGRPSLATKEKGKILFDAEVAKLVELIKEFKVRAIVPRVDNHRRKPEIPLDYLLRF